jgi:hypothetical protein
VLAVLAQTAEETAQSVQWQPVATLAAALFTGSAVLAAAVIAYIFGRRQKEHEVTFAGVYERRADAIADMYGEIADLDQGLPAWISYLQNIEARKEILNKQRPSQDQQNREEQERIIREETQESIKQFAGLESKLLHLKLYFERQRIWFSETTCQKIEDIIKLQEGFLRNVNPDRQLEYEGFILLANEASKAQQNTEILLRGGDLPVDPPQEPMKQPESVPPLALIWWRKNQTNYRSALRDARTQLEDEFQDVLRVEKGQPRR